MMQLVHNLIPREPRLSIIDVIFSLALREDPPRVTLSINHVFSNQQQQLRNNQQRKFRFNERQSSLPQIWKKTSVLHLFRLRLI